LGVPTPDPAGLFVWVSVPDPPRDLGVPTPDSAGLFVWVSVPDPPRDLGVPTPDPAGLAGLIFWSAPLAVIEICCAGRVRLTSRLFALRSGERFAAESASQRRALHTGERFTPEGASHRRALHTGERFTPESASHRRAPESASLDTYFDLMVDSFFGSGAGAAFDGGFFGLCRERASQGGGFRRMDDSNSVDAHERSLADEHGAPKTRV
jgi:hypothetical protein